MRHPILLPLCSLALLLASCAPSLGPDAPSIVPRPLELRPGQGHFTLTASTPVEWPASDTAPAWTASYFAEQCRSLTGLALQAQAAPSAAAPGAIRFERVADSSLGAEGYLLDVRPDGIAARARTEAGLFYAAQSLLQLLPLPAEGTVFRASPRLVPCVAVRDTPRFAWRGMHLDVSRHFFPKSFLFTYIDMLAMHKLNVFHWHLTDDQGWRLEIRRYPRLTSVGAWRVDREAAEWSSRLPQDSGERATYGGFYTQDDAREVVAYAARRGITVVPEIEMPAHCMAALAAYPEHSCTGRPITVPPGGVWPLTDIFCAGNDSTIAFLENVLSEVMEIFPSQYIHIGGDEATKTEWKRCRLCQERMQTERLKDEDELQSWFVRRIESFLLSRGRRLIGWDEILEGGLAPQAAVMSWRGTEGGIAAARAHHDVVMSPTSHCYFDYRQGPASTEPRNMGGSLTLTRVYSFEPVPAELTPEERPFIRGVQANLWTEYVPSPSHAQYMTLPRMAALAEVAWTAPGRRSWPDFSTRVPALMRRYRARGWTCAESAWHVGIGTVFDSARSAFLVSLATELPAQEIRFTRDGSEPSLSSERYEAPFLVGATTTIRAAAFDRGRLIGHAAEREIRIHKAFGKPVALATFYEKYTGGGPRALTDGMRGTTYFNDGFWQGYHQADLDATVDLGAPTDIARVEVGFLETTPSWIFLPTALTISVSDDGGSFRTLYEDSYPVPKVNHPPKIVTWGTPTHARARYVRVQARNVGICPPWHAGKGDKAWLFVDEIIVE